MINKALRVRTGYPEPYRIDHYLRHQMLNRHSLHHPHHRLAVLHRILGTGSYHLHRQLGTQPTGSYHQPLQQP